MCCCVHLYCHQQAPQLSYMLLSNNSLTGKEQLPWLLVYPASVISWCIQLVLNPELFCLHTQGNHEGTLQVAVGHGLLAAWHLAHSRGDYLPLSETNAAVCQTCEQCT